MTTTQEGTVNNRAQLHTKKEMKYHLTVWACPGCQTKGYSIEQDSVATPPVCKKCMVVLLQVDGTYSNNLATLVACIDLVDEGLTNLAKMNGSLG